MCRFRRTPEQAQAAAKSWATRSSPALPFAGGTKADGDSNTDIDLNRTWRPQLAVTAMDGYPLPENGGNVLLPYSTAKLSLRLPPTCDAERRAPGGEKSWKKIRLMTPK